MCLTQNFIPYYQKPLTSDSNSFLNKPNHRVSEYVFLLFFKLENKVWKFFLISIDYTAPAIYQGTFDVPNGIYDTFLKMDKFTKVKYIFIINWNKWYFLFIKGVAFIKSNDTLTNLGRYWPHLGPQVTLYIPGVLIFLNLLKSDL